VNAARSASTSAASTVQPAAARVAAVAREVTRAGVQAGEQVERGDRAPGARSAIPVERDHQNRAVMALGQARGDDADHARMPVVSGEHVGRLVASRGNLCLGLEQDPRLDVAPAHVGLVELAGDLLGACGVAGQEQFDAGVGAVHAAGSVDPRSQPEADRLLVDRSRVRLADAHQRAQALARGP